MAHAWNACWVNRPQGFKSPILRREVPEWVLLDLTEPVECSARRRRPPACRRCSPHPLATRLVHVLARAVVGQPAGSYPVGVPPRSLAPASPLPAFIEQAEPHARPRKQAEKGRSNGNDMSCDDSLVARVGAVIRGGSSYHARPLSQMCIKMYVDVLGAIRNAHAHNRVIVGHDAELLAGIAGHLRNQVNVYRS